MMVHTKSEALFAEALKYIPGGVNSPVRAFRAVGGQPFFVNRAQGARVFDVDGNDYIDYVCTWGPAILGHAHPRIIRAVQEAAGQGTSFGIPNPLEVTLAKLIRTLVPSVEKVRMCNSGTEACMSAIRLARGFTKRDKIIKFDGCYHGHADSLLVKAGSGALTFGDRSDILNLASARVEELKKNGNKNVELYGLSELEGLQMVYVLSEGKEDSQSKYGLPENPRVPASAQVWSYVFKPVRAFLVMVLAFALWVNKSESKHAE